MSMMPKISRDYGNIHLLDKISEKIGLEEVLKEIYNKYTISELLKMLKNIHIIKLQSGITYLTEIPKKEGKDYLQII